MRKIMIVLLLKLLIASYAQHEPPDTMPENHISSNFLGDAALILTNYGRLFLLSPMLC